MVSKVSKGGLAHSFLSAKNVGFRSSTQFTMLCGEIRGVMAMYLKPLDCNGKKIAAGDRVLYMRATEHLLRGLPEEDQQAINAQVGKILTVVQFDDYGYAELEFDHDITQARDQYHTHTIWVEPEFLKKVE